MNISVRHVGPEDHTAVHEIFCSQAVIDGTMRLPLSPAVRVKERLEPADDRIQLVALVDGEVVGFSELITFPTTPRHNHVGEVNMLVVREGWTHRGTGRRLMKEMVNLADEFATMHNFHFRDEVAAGRMIFDYQLRPGPCPTTNALKIMRMEGLPVE